MSDLGLAAVLTLIAVVVLAAPEPVPAQTRTPWGDPDLRGAWSNTTRTPLQRPADLEGERVSHGGGMGRTGCARGR